ncbi:MAG: hypothetical protein Q9220_005843 [cf. Caloplaca sp. 1 TL-2023]
MIINEAWLPWAVLVLTAVSIFLLSLPSARGADKRFLRDPSEDGLRVQVVVLGDIGRSPRIQYHAISISKHGGFVDLIGYAGNMPLTAIFENQLIQLDSNVHPLVEDNPNIRVHGLLATPGLLQTSNKWLFLLLAPFKVAFQTLALYYTLGYRTAPARWLLVQNPPTIPTMLVAQIICFIRNTRLIVDWHNFGYSILGLKLGLDHPLVQLSSCLERMLSSRAAAHLTVSNAMARFLESEWGVTGPVLPLHDRPFPQFQPLDSSHRQHFLERCPETAASVGKIQTGKVKVLVSSTSWTPDEDFSLLLDACITYSELASSTHPDLPEVLAIITGNGPLKAAFLSRIQTLRNQGKLDRVQIRTAWLSMEDYASLLASADLGVSLHTSSSGVDLPMKVVDMLGAGLPVLGWAKFAAWSELIHEGVNGRGFGSSAELADALVELFGDNDQQQLQRLRQGALLEGKRRWDDEWDPVAGRLLGLCK